MLLMLSAACVHLPPPSPGWLRRHKPPLFEWNEVEGVDLASECRNDDADAARALAHTWLQAIRTYGSLAVFMDETAER